VAGKFFRKAPGIWVTPHLRETGPLWKFGSGSRAFLALVITLCLRVASWIRSTVVPEARAQKARTVVALGRLPGAMAGRVDQARRNAPRAALWARKHLTTLGVGIRLGVVASVRSTRHAVAWIQRVAIPVLRDSDAIRYMRRRRPEVAFFAGTVAVGIAVGLVVVGLLRRF
jgi:hypothetical protein